MTAPPITLPVTKIGVAALISPSQAATYYGSSTTSTDGLAAVMGYTAGTPIPPEIWDLARALKFNPDLIYEYVHNNVAVDWMYGLQKGALGTVIDKAGTPFDQVALMIALLNQSGYAASYVSGTITLSGAQFTAWTGISDSNAACQMLANGGIPAIVNGSTSTTCATGSGSSISSVTMSHIWVSANIPGSACGGTCLFDPSYKTYTWKPGISLTTAAQFTSGQAMSAATTGMTSGTISGTSVPYVNGLNGTSLTNTISTYAQNLLAYIENSSNTVPSPSAPLPSGTPLQSAHVEDIVGGGVVIPYNYSPTNLVRQTSLPYSPSASQTWACSASPASIPTTLCNVPNQYRTTLTVQGHMWDFMNGVPQGQYYNGTSGAYDAMFGQYCPPNISCSAGEMFFVDQIYGRMLTVTTDYGLSMNQFSPTISLQFDNQNVGTPYSDPPIVESDGQGGTIEASSRGAEAYMTLTANHPYAASANGSATTCGSYGSSTCYLNTTVIKEVNLIMPLTIVHGWGDTGPGLADKWSTERPSDKQMPYATPPPCNGNGSPDGNCTNLNPGGQGDFDREKIAASWLGQYTRAAHLHAQIAGSVAQLHHELGVIYSDAVLSPSYPNGPGGGPSFTEAESFTRLDVDSAFSVSSKTASQSARNAAVVSIAALSAALEGSAAAQSDGLPDTASTATRFEWGNAPPGTSGNWDAPSTSSPNAYEDPPHAVRSFVQFNSADASQANNAALVENHPLSYYNSGSGGNGVDAWGSQPDLGADAGSFVSAYAGEIQAYANSSLGSFTITTSQEAFLGPGQRGGAINPADGPSGQPYAYTHFLSKQRGPALIATLYDGSGNPTAVAHDVVAVDYSGFFGTKGGGAGVEANNASTYDPAQAGDILKSQFVDKSNELGVNLSNGSVGYTAPAKVDVGSGGFPYELSAQFEWNSAPNTSWAPPPLTTPQPGWTTNWHTDLSMSGSALEAMGKTDIRAMVNTVATMMALQDINSSSPSISRDVASSIAIAWWVRQVQGNAVTVRQGAKSEQFLETTPGNWIMPGNGFASLTQTGNRVPYEYICAPQGSSTPPYALSRGWNYANMSFAVKSAHGDIQNFAYWLDQYSNDDFDHCGLATGFRLSTWTFPQGPTITLHYLANVWDPDGPAPAYPPLGVGFDELGSVTNSVGREIVFTYDQLGDLLGFNNGLSGANLRTVSLGFSTSTSATTITDPAGAVTSFAFAASGPSIPVAYRPNNNGFLSQIFTADNSSVPNVQYDYDGEGHVLDVQDAVRLQVGGRNPYEFYVAEGTRGERDDPLGDGWAVTYDIYGQPFRFVNELGYETDAVADGRGRVLQYIYPEQDQELFTYDDRGNTLSYAKVPKPGCTPNCPSNIVISATWDPNWNKPLSITDGNGNITNFTYYAVGQNGASEIENATRPAVSGGNPTYNFSYDANGKLLTATDPITSSTSIEMTNSYDSNEDLLSSTIDSGSGHLNLTASFNYDAIGNVVTTMDPRGYVTTTTYDADRRRLEGDHHNGNVSANLNSSSRTIYDALGRDIEDDLATAFSGTSVSAWTVVKKTTYTPTSKVAAVKDGDSATATTAYDNDDRVNIVTDPVGRQTQHSYDAAGHLLVETRALGTPLQEAYATYTYGTDGEKLSVYDADGPTHTTTYAYDGFNRLLTTTFPDSSTETITSYDANSNILSRKNRAGCQLSAQYDALNRQTSKTIPSGGNCGLAPPDIVSYTYDLGGRKTGYSDTLNNAITLTNDTAGRLISIATTIPGLSGVLSTSYVLDANGNRTKLTWPDGYYATYAYDSLNRLVNAADSVATGYLATYTYDDFSRRTNVTYFNGASIAYAYTTASDLTSLINTLNGAPNNLSYTLSYTGAHELNGETFSNLAYEFQPTIGTDAFAAVNALNQYPSITLAGQSQSTLSYDGDGNLTGGGGWSYTYDAENKLMSACNASPCSGASVSAFYAYDPLGRRTQKSGAGVATTFFLNDGSDEIAEYSSSGAVLRRFAPGPAINEPIVYENCSGATAPNCTGPGPVYEYFQTDHHGSVVAMSGTSGVSVEGPYTYDGYGNGAPLTGVPFKFVGMYLDAETGLYYDRARYYSPLQGRFLQTDPVGYKDDLDMYTYVADNPINQTDPSGMTNNCGSGNTGSRIQGSDSGHCEGEATYLADKAAAAKEIVVQLPPSAPSSAPIIGPRFPGVHRKGNSLVGDVPVECRNFSDSGDCPTVIAQMRGINATSKDGYSINLNIRGATFGEEAAARWTGEGIVVVYFWAGQGEDGANGSENYQNVTLYAKRAATTPPHEIGHVLGFGHSGDPKSVMYQYSVPGRLAHPNDQEIRELVTSYPTQ